MNNYPDNAQPGALDAPWNREDSEPTCVACGGQLDDAAVEAGDLGWASDHLGGYCSSCADEQPCDCSDRGFCSPRCVAQNEREWAKAERREQKLELRPSARLYSPRQFNELREHAIDFEIDLNDPHWDELVMMEWSAYWRFERYLMSMGWRK